MVCPILLDDPQGFSAEIGVPLISLLLVDDNPKLLDILKDYLQDHYADEVIVTGIASDGQEARYANLTSHFQPEARHLLLFDSTIRVSKSRLEEYTICQKHPLKC